MVIGAQTSQSRQSFAGKVNSDHHERMPRRQRRPIGTGSSGSSILTPLASFRFGKEGSFVLARKSRDCAEAYMGTPHKEA